MKHRRLRCFSAVAAAEPRYGSDQWCWQFADEWLKSNKSVDKLLATLQSADDWTLEVCIMYGAKGLPQDSESVIASDKVRTACASSLRGCVVACGQGNRSLEKHRELASRFNEFCP